MANEALEMNVEHQEPQGRTESARPAIELSNVTVSFRSYTGQPTSFKESVLRFLKHGPLQYYSTFNALSDVSFSIKHGEVMGFIGSNGAGKSTLLRVLAGVLRPATGSVGVYGKVGSLIQLGAGFEPDLDAIENIYLNASLYQISKEEIAASVPKILEFAELQQFAKTPVKYYSAGMYARLGFSVAIHRNPDILIVDEVIGVGDERFQKKCVELIRQFVTQGKTIVLVAHDLKMIESLSHRVGLLSKGKLVFNGDPATAIERYRSQTYERALG